MFVCVSLFSFLDCQTVNNLRISRISFKVLDRWAIMIILFFVQPIKLSSEHRLRSAMLGVPKERMEIVISATMLGLILMVCRNNVVADKVWLQMVELISGTIASCVKSVFKRAHTYICIHRVAPHEMGAGLFAVGWFVVHVVTSRSCGTWDASDLRPEITIQLFQGTLPIHKNRIVEK